MTYNSSELAETVAKTLGLTADAELALFNELTQIGNGPVKIALNKLCELNELSRINNELTKTACDKLCERLPLKPAKKIRLTDEGWALISHSANFHEATQLYLIEGPNERNMVLIGTDPTGKVITHMPKSYIVME